jgi:hypothetical protein
MSARNSILLGLVGVIAGFVLALAAEMTLLLLLSELFHVRLMPRGVGWIVVPIFGAIAGWRFGRNFNFGNAAYLTSRRLSATPRLTRLWVAGSVFWIMSALTFFAVFNPYGSYWSSDEWHQFWMVLIAPPVLGLVGGALFRWATKPNSDIPEPPSMSAK